MKRQSIFIVIIAIMLLSLVFSACEAKPAENTTEPTKEAEATKEAAMDEEAASEFNELGTFPISETTKEFSILTPWKIEAPIEENWNTVEYESMTNVHIDWQTVPADGWVEKRSIIIASGNLPDAIAAGGTFGGSAFTATDIEQYGSQGVFIPLQDWIQSDTLYLKNYVNENPLVAKYVASLDGNIYSLFSVNECYHCNHSQKAWINTDWLENLGLEMPKTTAELKDVLMAFKTQDPNQNGIADEIPLATCTDGWRTNLDGFLMCAFVYMDSDQMLLFDDNKQIQFAPAQDGYREGLRYLTDLYNEDLIAPESFTQSSQVLAQTNESGDSSVIGVGFGGVNFLVSGQSVSERWKEYDAIPPLTGPDGFATVATYGSLAPASVGLFTITNAAEDPALIMRWMDYFYSEDGRNFIDIGKEGRDWRAGEEGELDFNGNPARFVEIVPQTELIENNIIWEQTFPCIRDASYREGKMVISQDWREGDGNFELMLFQATKNYVPFAPPVESLVPTIAALPEKLTDFSLLKTSLTDYVKQSVARFVTGDLDIEEDWDNYIGELENLGLQQYLDICQESYEAKYVD